MPVLGCKTQSGIKKPNQPLCLVVSPLHFTHSFNHFNPFILFVKGQAGPPSETELVATAVQHTMSPSGQFGLLFHVCACNILSRISRKWSINKLERALNFSYAVYFKSITTYRILGTSRSSDDGVCFSIQMKALTNQLLIHCFLSSPAKEKDSNYVTWN